MTDRMKEAFGRFRKTQMFWPVIVLILMLIFNAFFTKNFFVISITEGHLYGNVIDILKNVAPLALLAIGMTLVIATAGIDISVGSVVAISGALACSILDGRLGIFDHSFAAALIFGIAAGTVCGLWNGLLIAKVRIQPIVATLILMTAGRGIAQLITNGQIVTIDMDPAMPQYYFLSSGYIFGLPFSMFIALFMLLAVLLFVKRSSFGLFLESLGVNGRASGLAGIKVDTIKMIVYIVSGTMAGIAGLIISSNIKAADCNNAGLFIELDAILSVAIGGTSLYGGRFSIPASVVGALIIQTLTTTILAMGVSPQTISLVKAIVVVAICLFQSAEFRRNVLFRFLPRRKGAEA